MDNAKLQSGGESIPQVLKNPVFLQETKKPCKMLQGENLPQVEVEQNSKDPCFYGTSDDTDNSRPLNCPQSDFFARIIDLFDRLDADQQTDLLEALTARIQTAAETSR